MEYTGPERRQLERFTREDSDRLVRIEEKCSAIPDIMVRLSKVEKKTNWILGVGAGITTLAGVLFGSSK